MAKALFQAVTIFHWVNLSRWRLLILLSMSAVMLSVARTQEPVFNLPSSETPVYASTTMLLDKANHLVVVNAQENTISIIDPAEGVILAEIPVWGMPVSIAQTPDGSRYIVANRGGQSVSVVDRVTLAVQTFAVFDLLTGSAVEPLAIISDDDDRALILTQNAVLRLDLTTGDLQLDTLLPADFQPVSLAQWGDFLYVRPLNGLIDQFISGQNNGALSLRGENQINPVGTLVIDARADLLYFVTTAMTGVNSQAPFDLAFGAQLHIVNLQQFAVQQTVSLDVVDEHLHLPAALALNADRTRLYITYSASNRISVIDLRTNTRLFSKDTGANPQAIVFSRDAQQVYVHNRVDRSISVFDTQYMMIQDTLPTTTILPDARLLLGARLFHTASDPRMSWNNSASCATCHAENALDMPLLQDNTRILAFSQNDGILAHLVNTQGGTGIPALEVQALVEYLLAQNAP